MFLNWFYVQNIRNKHSILFRPASIENNGSFISVLFPVVGEDTSWLGDLLDRPE